jgi:hypothetical protein
VARVRCDTLLCRLCSVETRPGTWLLPGCALFEVVCFVLSSALLLACAVSAAVRLFAPVCDRVAVPEFMPPVLLDSFVLRSVVQRCLNAFCLRLCALFVFVSPAGDLPAC